MKLPAQFIRSCRRLFLILFCALFSLSATAAEYYAARLLLDPPQPFVNQPCALLLDLLVSPGCELQNVTISGLPADLPLELGQLVGHPATRETEAGRTVERHRFRATGRATAAFSLQVEPLLQFTLVERRTTGFFSSWNSTQQRLRIPATTLTVRPLPAAGRPADFSGAVGRFTLEASATPDEVMPQDLVTLTWLLRGSGYRGTAAPQLPRLDPQLFKLYPPEVKESPEQGLYSVTQVVIPQSTQAVEIASASFNFFDPVAAAYRTISAGPCRLTFTSRSATTEPAIRHLPLGNSEKRSTSALEGEESFLQRSEVVRLLPFAIAVAAGFVILLLLYPLQRHLALVVALLVVVVTLWGSQRLLQQRSATLLTLHETASLQLAPGPRAATIMELPPGTTLLPLERSGGWLRVEAAGRRGWLRESLVLPSSPRASSAM